MSEIPSAHLNDREDASEKVLCKDSIIEGAT